LVKGRIYKGYYDKFEDLIYIDGFNNGKYNMGYYDYRFKELPETDLLRILYD